eukprot:gene1810-1098_t
MIDSISFHFVDEDPSATTWTKERGQAPPSALSFTILFFFSPFLVSLPSPLLLRLLLLYLVGYTLNAAAAYEAREDAAHWRQALFMCGWVSISIAFAVDKRKMKGRREGGMAKKIK